MTTSSATGESIFSGDAVGCPQHRRVGLPRRLSRRASRMRSRTAYMDFHRMAIFAGSRSVVLIVIARFLHQPALDRRRAPERGRPRRSRRSPGSPAGGGASTRTSASRTGRRRAAGGPRGRARRRAPGRTPSSICSSYASRAEAALADEPERLADQRLVVRRDRRRTRPRRAAPRACARSSRAPRRRPGTRSARGST